MSVTPVPNGRGAGLPFAFKLKELPPGTKIPRGLLPSSRSAHETMKEKPRSPSAKPSYFSTAGSTGDTLGASSIPTHSLLAIRMYWTTSVYQIIPFWLSDFFLLFLNIQELHSRYFTN